ncbi:MAG: class I SAM-dependent methyltransferase [Gammaproteobacteria bacterium]|nr:class I SAM-dependent methyltransferase [Gammaproteobacteria bacterium]
MKIDDRSSSREATELEIMKKHLPMKGARVLELGCGGAMMTRKIAKAFQPELIIATEVDKIQHQKNRLITDLNNVKFVLGGAQAIDLPEESIDLVIMLKSLHHVPTELMDTALAEIHRVLRPGGLAYLSEPIYRGNFNDIMKLFHDEMVVRNAAFDAVQRAVDEGFFDLITQIFFDTPGYFRNFSEFESRMLNVTHTEHQIDAELNQRIRDAFERHMTPQGANFLKPSRVDLLKKHA